MVAVWGGLDLRVGEVFEGKERRHRHVREEDRPLLAKEDRALIGECHPLAVRAVEGPHRRVGHLAAVVPRQDEAVGRVLPRREGEAGFVLHPERFGRRRRAVGEERPGRAELEGAEDRIKNVDRHVAHRAAAEVVPAPPVAGVVLIGAVEALGRRAEPQVPVEVSRLRPRGRLRAVVAPGLAAPRVRFADLADDPALNELHRRAVLRVGVDLRAHLRDERRMGRGDGAELTGFVDIVRQRFLAVDMLAVVEGRHRRRGVGVVGGGDMDGVDRAGELVEHLPEVGEPLRPFVDLTGGGKVAGVDIAQRYHLDVRMGGERGEIGPPHAADTDPGQTELVVGGRPADACERGERKGDAGERGVPEEAATGDGGHERLLRRIGLWMKRRMEREARKKGLGSDRSMRSKVSRQRAGRRRCWRWREPEETGPGRCRA